MGIFSSKKKHYVSTSVVRVVEDSLVPDIKLTALVESIMGDTGITETLIDTALNSKFRNFEKMYRKAAAGDYVYGLPDVKILDSTAGHGAAQTVIESIVGQAVTLEYIHFRPPNNVHLGWQEVTENYGYVADNNELTVLSATKGFPVYLNKLVARHYVDGAATEGTGEDAEAAPAIPEITARGIWGDSPSAGYMPDRWSGAIAGFTSLVKDQEWLEGAGYDEGVEVHYRWEDAEGETYDEFLVIDLTAYDPDLEYYQAKYRYNPGSGEVIKYWTYQPDDGLYPTLDSVFDLNYVAPGTHFPFIMFRSNHENRTADELMETAEFKSTEALLKTVGIDFKTLGDNIHENPDVADVEQAVMMMGVPIDTENEIEIEYLFRYFTQIDALTPGSTETFMEQQSKLTYARNSSYAMEIADADFRLIISYDDIRKRLRAGTIGPVGTYTNSTSPYVVGDNPLYPPRPGGSGTLRYLRKQVSTGVYEEICIDNPIARYDIYRGKGVMADEETGTFLIPLDYEIARTLPLLDREALYYRSLHLVFNSRITKKVKWYQRGAFKILLIIVAVVIAFYTGQFEAIIAAASVGAAAVAVAVITLIIKAIVVQLIFKLVVEAVGPELAFVIALVAAAYGVFTDFSTTMGGMLIDAKTLVGAALGLANEAMTVGMKEKFAEYNGDLQEFNLMTEQKWEELEEVSKLLDTHSLLNPFAFIGQAPRTIFGERPDAYFYRTVHAGNVGVLSLNIIENFVSASLTLPDIDSTIGDTFYA